MSGERLRLLRQKFAERRRPRTNSPVFGVVPLRSDLPADFDDTNPRHWCSDCGMPDPPMPDNPWDFMPDCPQCGSKWRWYGRLQDIEGTATGDPPTPCCYEYRRFPGNTEHFGWCWWRVCDGCDHAHHDGEVWIG